jgi:regulator of extracellular matrix RemA (YlzA/DUF370 family)
MNGELLHVGFGHMISSSDLLAITVPKLAAAKRLLQRARDEQRTLDLTDGRQTKAVFILANGSIALAALTPETITGRATRERALLTAAAPE